MGKRGLMIWAALATVGAMPALAQDAPVAAREKPKASETLSGSPGAASSSYARCAPGSPISGIVVKGGVNPTRRTGEAEPEGNCPSTDPAEGKGRTYTGGRRNADAPSAAVEATTAAPVTGNEMPSRLSMPPATIKAVAPAAPTVKSISEQGVAASKPSRPSKPH